MKAIIGYVLIIVLAISVAWIVYDRRSEVNQARQATDTQYDDVIARANAAVAGPDGQADDAERQAFVTYLSPKAEATKGQALIIKQHVANGKADPSFLFDVYTGDKLIGTYDRSTLEGFFYGRGNAHDIDSPDTN